MRSRLFPLFAIVVLVLLGYGTYQALMVAPTERSMGDAQRIFYVHVPAAVAAYTLFTVNFVASIVFLWKRKEAADALALASAEAGLVFATVVLITGPIWARYAWGTWWTWEPRLITFLVLWLLYVSYLFLRRSAEGGGASTLAAALAVFAFVDVPFSYFASQFILLRGHHPTRVIASSGTDPQIRHVLLINMLAFVAFAALLLWFRYELESASRKLAAIHVQRAAATAMRAMLPPMLLLQIAPQHDPRNFMYAAYIAAWTIYVGYILLLIAKAARLKKEASELGL